MRGYMFGLMLILLGGCMKPLDQQVQKDPNSIIGKKTQDITAFDPNAGAVVSDSKVNVTNPITGPLEAYGPMIEQISKTQIEAAVNIFYATEGRYPASLEEFMDLIIKPNNIQLPVLPGGKKYQYDVANHKLVVIDAPPE